MDIPGARPRLESISGDLKQMALEVENKAHNDKPFFSAAVRLGVTRAGKKAETLLDALSAFLGLFQHGGRPLVHLTDQEYADTEREAISVFEQASEKPLSKSL